METSLSLTCDAQKLTRETSLRGLSNNVSLCNLSLRKRLQALFHIMFKQRLSAWHDKHAHSLRTFRVTTMSSLRSPLHILGPLILLSISIPLTIFAAITTLTAIGALTLRASIIYFELMVALIQAYLFPSRPKAAPSKRPSSRRTSPHRSRRRGSIASSSSSLDALGSSRAPPRLNNKSASFVSLFGTGEPTRDYEGVGGWRVTDGPDEDAIWLGMNSRLELPAMTPRNHHRSLTGGSQSPRKWSPVQSRARTPSHMDEKHNGGGYFPLHPSGSSSRLRSMQDARRKSTSTSSTNSVSSAKSVSIKLPGE